MGMTNNEKQAAWRARQLANKQRVVDLQKEVERLKRKLAEAPVSNPPKVTNPPEAGDGGLATGYRLFDDIDAKIFADLVEQQVCDGKASPSAVHMLGKNLQFTGEAYWGRDGKWGTRKRMTLAQKNEAIQKRRDAFKKRQAKAFDKD